MTTPLPLSPITASPATAGRFCLDDHELTSGDHVFLEINDHLLEGRVEFDWASQRYVAWIGAAALPLRVGLRARRIVT